MRQASKGEQVSRNDARSINRDQAVGLRDRFDDDCHQQMGLKHTKGNPR